VTRCALDCISVAKIFIPAPQQAFSILLHEFLDPVDLCSAESPAILKSDGIKPELGFIAFTLNVNMGRLITITRVTKEPIGADSQ
jgi:hypothetical protein